MIIPDISSVQCMGGMCVRYSYMLFLIFPAILFLLWFIPKNFVKFANRLEQKEYENARRPLRRTVLWLRLLALLFMIIAVASPFKLTDKTVPGNPRLTILVDNSTSMELFDSSVGQNLFKALENQVPVKIRTIASGEDSSLGSGLLNHLEGGEHLLVVSDGQSHGGKLLGDVMLFSSQINATISTLDISAIHKDASVFVEGPSELIKDNEGEFRVTVNTVGEGTYHVKAVIDNSLLVLDEEGKGTKIFTIPKIFTDAGSHTLTAEITQVSDDYFNQNNIYYKSIKVVPRPSILIVADAPSPLSQQLERLYLVDLMSTVPSNLDKYMAVIIDNLPASRILPYFETLNDFVDDGNGLIVFGGDKAYESGGYKGTLLETLLPVKMGAGEESEKSDVNVVVLIDISDSSDLEAPFFKAFAISIVDSLNDKNNVGVVAFNSDAYEVAPIKPLASQEKEIKEKIMKLNRDGQSLYYNGLKGAYDLLKDVGGSKNIIMITDGGTIYEQGKIQTIDTARNLNARGVTIYTVGYGTRMTDDEHLFLDNTARVGGGMYFKVDATNKLSVLFGEPDPSKDPEYYNSLIALDTTHFITRGLEIGATISGYNYVVPKPAASLLVSTNKNIPIVVVWRFGLGRVVSIATDDGARWSGELLSKKNSPLLTKSINWGIGDLSRKKAFDVTIHDTSAGVPTSIDVVANDMPSEKGLLFAKIDTNFYSADYTPNKSGYFTLLGATGAANYPKEYERLGMNQEFLSLVQATGGEAFDPKDTEKIIEFLKSHSKRIKIDSYDLRWPFLIAALALFLIDIAYRRIKENQLMKR